MEQTESYRKSKLPELIEKLKEGVDILLPIISDTISSDITDDKVHNAIKAKTMARQEVADSLKLIDDLTSDLNGEERVTQDKNVHPSKRHAR